MDSCFDLSTYVWDQSFKMGGRWLKPTNHYSVHSQKKGGHLTPREVRMSDRLYRIMVRRFITSPSQIPYVFWQTQWSHKKRQRLSGPYGDRHKLMRTLCKKAKVRYFRFHPLRRFGATTMDQSNFPIGDIQKILGHENRETTEIYLHSIRKSQDRAIDILDNAYGF